MKCGVYVTSLERVYIGRNPEFYRNRNNNIAGSPPVDANYSFITIRLLITTYVYICICSYADWRRSVVLRNVRSETSP